MKAVKRIREGFYRVRAVKPFNNKKLLGEKMRKGKHEEKRDGLGFTPSEYFVMQCRLDNQGKQNETLMNGWDITREQISLINDCNHWLHRVAVIAFYDVNYNFLRCMAYRFLSPIGKNYRLISVVSPEDLLQQLFCDMLSGHLKLPKETEKIRSAIYECFRFAAVGGLGVMKNGL